MPAIPFDRRTLIRSAAWGCGGFALSSALPAWARSGTPGLAGPMATISGEDIALSIGHAMIGIGGREGHAVGINGATPGPVIRLKEGQRVRLAVTNTLAEESSIHWHGLLVPFQMDGVAGVSFPGIKAGQAFTYEFPVRQSGTYWYHSHSGMQEAMGMYGAIVIDPAGPDPARYDREHVILLADWSFTHPHELLRKLKAQGGYFNMQKQTLSDLLAGKEQSASERRMWAKMRMDPTDISDVTGSTYHYLVNGHDCTANWTGLFTPGERVRLRIINASAMTNFNVRIPGLPMTVVAADGQNVQPVETDEFQIGIAETYDVIVQPSADMAYGFIAEAIDRSGQVRATLAPRLGMVAPIPVIRERPLLTMKDMGMGEVDMSGGGHSGHGAAAPAADPMPGMDMSGSGDMSGMDMSGGSMNMRDPSVAPQVKLGPGVATLSPMPMDRTGERPTGLEKVDHRVLTYHDLRSLAPNADTRTPSREIDLHLTANMERYMWSFDGEKFSENTEPIPFRHMERVRVNLINDTMMPHPIHLHGHFFELVTGNPGHHPMKHTVNVLPGGKVSFDLTADGLGDWAFHCHMLLHMMSGMFRVVTVRHEEDAA
ncbi:copper resistance system multicopper oxidase [Sphingobium phenoxybenzoativorans]|jgi:CopA family copper-resistance protein|uniref:Copper resistance system multicopper oxidase n=1 Tax=Sphingobium phenoxybenzoativorans TaxID=1592790 RepID=A0A975KB29_9SPHN|nr:MULTISPECIES: copper resistance system multicopper oxidase [Sphingobium]QUT07654.1 copper resistance system multicopper oxidase [Sphingobium phenoxybenzoativorans]